MVRVCLLGDVRVELDEECVELGSLSRKARLLLAMLALERRVHGRSELAGRLWPDVREDSARVSLRTALSQLRSALGPGAALMLRGERDGGVGLAAEVGTDVGEVERLLAAGEPEAALDRCSSQLLAGIDDDWVLERRDDLRDRVAHGLGAAAAHAEEAGDLRRAVDLTRRMAALDPLAETPHRELIRRLTAAGDRGAALAAYERFRDRLADELRIVPSAATRSLVEELRAEQSPGPARVPVVPTPTLGREHDLARLRALLADPVTRLVTVVGPGGVGKTRVALEVGRMLADTRADGAGFVSLASVAESEAVGFAIAQALDVLIAPDMPIDELLMRYFARRNMLLILDNCEHVLDAAPLLADLLAVAPGLVVLVTSREPLRLRGEHVFELSPLALPATADGEQHHELQRSPAVALFIQTAHAQDPTFAPTAEELSDIAVLCRRLDGLPLAIELAAGRVALLSTHELMRRLGEGIDALGRGPRDAPQRQQTLQATLNWSYDLLDADEQAAFAHMSVFAGGADLETAQAVAATPLERLEALVAKHLVVRTRTPDGTWRLGMLDTIREFARARLAARPDAELIALRHAQHFLELGEEAAAELRRSASVRVAAGLDPEIDNLRAALTWALERPAPELALRLAVAFDEYLQMRNPAEGQQWVERALVLADARVPARVRAAALHHRAMHLNDRSAWADAEAAARENLALCEELDDARGRAISLTDVGWARLVRLVLGGQRSDGATVEQQRHEVADIAREAVAWARRAGDDEALASALTVRALAAETLEQALDDAGEAAALYARAGNALLTSFLWANLAYKALGRGDHTITERSLRLARGAAERSGQPGEQVLVMIDGRQGLLDLFRGNHSAAAEAFSDELRLARRYGFDRWLGEGLLGVAMVVAGSEGDPATAARLCGAADARTTDRLPASVLTPLDTILESARGRLGGDDWARAYAAGRELDVGDAVELALAVASSMRSARADVPRRTVA